MKKFELQINHEKPVKEVKTFHKNSNTVAFHRIEYSEGFWKETTYNEKGKELLDINSKGFWAEWIYDENGKRLAYANALGFYYIKGKRVSKKKFLEFNSESYAEK